MASNLTPAAADAISNLSNTVMWFMACMVGGSIVGHLLGSSLAHTSRAGRRNAQSLGRFLGFAIGAYVGYHISYRAPPPAGAFETGRASTLLETMVDEDECEPFRALVAKAAAEGVKGATDEAYANAKRFGCVKRQ